MRAHIHRATSAQLLPQVEAQQEQWQNYQTAGAAMPKAPRSYVYLQLDDCAMPDRGRQWCSFASKDCATDAIPST
jgi:hypothetical protein